MISFSIRLDLLLLLMEVMLQTSSELLEWDEFERTKSDLKVWTRFTWLVGRVLAHLREPSFVVVAGWWTEFRVSDWVIIESTCLHLKTPNFWAKSIAFLTNLERPPPPPLAITTSDARYLQPKQQPAELRHLSAQLSSSQMSVRPKWRGCSCCQLVQSSGWSDWNLWISAARNG